ncbi:hypothetical protein EST38_g7532 [Candolleomyces aberdarensis]|uniref:CFEM domain-containing protein n=1 Tax=Candolleomyces aberdarensis TaxID=2316362 RepID=A0A4V1Q3E6_9AGAR|nr:hypothetical protein EST38_g7532 [Candolleomyces aberdarensis]
MRFSAVVAFLGLAASVSASALLPRQLPDCALTCLSTADFGTCAQNDNACLCRSEAFVTSATTCITTDCQGDDLATALTLAQAMCAAEGVTLGTGTPTGTTSGGTTPPATTTGTNTAPTNTAPSTTTSGGAAQNTSGAMAHGLSSVAAIAAIALAAVSL